MSLLIKAVADFLSLTDTPAAYAGHAGKFPKVNVAEDALEFMPGGLSVWTKVFDGATDVPTATVWSFGCDMPEPKRSMGSVGLSGGLIYYISGNNTTPGHLIPDVDCYDPIEDSWTSKGDLPVGMAPNYMSETFVCDVGGLLYTECSQAPFNIYSYDPATDTWTDKAVAPTRPKIGTPGIVSGGLVYFPTDNGAPNYYTRMTDYDPGLNACTDHAVDGTHSHDMSALGETGGFIYLAGGFPAGICCDYDIGLNAWAANANQPADHQVLYEASGMLGAIFYIFGGMTSANVISKKSSAYDTVGDSWTGKEDMPDDRKFWQTGSVVYDGKVYCFAGVNGLTTADGQKTTYIFDPAEVYVLWEGTLNAGDAVAIYRPGGTARIYADGKIYLLAGSGTVFPIFTDSCPVRVEIPYTDDYTEIQVWIGEVA